MSMNVYFLHPSIGLGKTCILLAEVHAGLFFSTAESLSLASSFYCGHDME